jgi:hypothetical protein
MAMDMDNSSSIEKFVHEMLLSHTLNWEGMRISKEAHDEAKKDASAYDGHAPWQYRMGVGARMQEEGDKMANDVEQRALAEGVDIDALRGLVTHQMDKPRRP